MPGLQSWSWSDLTKKQAFTLHLLLSLLIFSSLIYVMALYWFPGELFFLDGGWQGLKLVAMVDLVLGPLLTLALYKPKKKGLVFDMSMIAAFQIAALAYGFHTTHKLRTVGIVYADGTFMTLSNNARNEADAKLLALDEQPKNLPDVERLKLPIVLSPDPKQGFGKYLEDLFNGYPELHERTDRFVAIDENLDALQEHALSKDELHSEGYLESVDASIAKLDITKDTLEVHRFEASFASGVAIYDTNTNRILDYIKKPEKQPETVADDAKSDNDKKVMAESEDAGN